MHPPKYIIAILFSISLFAETTTVIKITSIYDGDTFRANIKDYPKILGERMPIRINGIDTPELKGKCQQEKDLARIAKQFTVNKLRSGKIIELREMQRKKGSEKKGQVTNLKSIPIKC